MSQRDDDFSTRWPPFERVQALWGLGRLDESAALLREGATAHPDDVAFRMAEAHQTRLEDGGRIRPEALARVKKLIGEALAAEGENVSVLLAAAETLIEMEAVDSAEACVERIESLSHLLQSPDDQAGFAYVLGRVAFERHDAEAAERHFRLADSLKPEPEHAAGLIEALSAQDRKDEATHLLTEALVRYPDDRYLRSLGRELGDSPWASATQQSATGGAAVRYTSWT